MISSTLVEEVGVAGVGTFILILILAGNDRTPGSFRYKDTTHLARLFNMEPENLEKYLKVFEKTRRIKIKPLKDEFILTVIKWLKYQQDPKAKVGTQNQQKNVKVGTL